MRRGLVAAVLLAVAFGAWALAHRTPAAARPAPEAPRTRAPAARPGPAPRPDPAGLRNVFRYSDGARPEVVRAEEIAPPRAASEPPASAGPRLVGLVRRAGALVAALAVDGEVVLVSPGETAGGITVLSIDEEGVLFRRADGSEGRLTAS